MIPTHLLVKAGFEVTVHGDKRVVVLGVYYYGANRTLYSDMMADTTGVEVYLSMGMAYVGIEFIWVVNEGL